MRLHLYAVFTCIRVLVFQYDKCTVRHALFPISQCISRTLLPVPQNVHVLLSVFQCHKVYSDAYRSHVSSPSNSTLAAYFDAHNAYVQQLHAANAMVHEFNGSTQPQLLQVWNVLDGHGEMGPQDWRGCL